MSVGITLQELLGWNEEASAFWKAHLESNPSLLELPCDIGGTANVQEMVRHIWGVELRWAQRLAGLPVTPREEMPAGPWRLCSISICRRQRSFAASSLAPSRAGMSPSPSTFFPGRRTPSPGAKLPGICCFTASGTGRNWPRWCAPPASPRDSRETCCSLRL